MSGKDTSLLLVGIATWAVVAVVAVIAVQWDDFWGFFPVLAAVLAAWAISANGSPEGP